MNTGVGAAGTASAARGTMGLTARLGTEFMRSWFAADTPPPMAADTMGGSGAAEAAASIEVSRKRSEVFMDERLVGMVSGSPIAYRLPRGLCAAPAIIFHGWLAQGFCLSAWGKCPSFARMTICDVCNELPG